MNARGKFQLLAIVIFILIAVASCSVKKFTVTFDTNGGSDIAKQSVTKNKLASKPTNPTRNNYEFVEWQLNDEKFDFSTPITKNITLKAIWNIKTYIITFDSDGRTTVPPQTVSHGSKVVSPSLPRKDNYAFVGWSLGDDFYNFETPVTTNLTLKAIWQKTLVSYLVNFDSDGGSAVASLTVNEGNKNVKPTNPAKADHTFVKWQLDGIDWLVVSFGGRLSFITFIKLFFGENKS